MNKRGFVCFNINNEGLEKAAAEILQYCCSQCDELYVGLLADSFWEKMMMSDIDLNFIQRKDLIDRLCLPIKVIEISEKNASIIKIWEEIKFTVFFNGSRYGESYLKDIEFLKIKGIESVCLWSKGGLGIDALTVFFRQQISIKKLIIFGSGQYFRYYMDTMCDIRRPDYLVDNDKTKWGEQSDGLVIKSPEYMFQSENSESVIILVCVKNYEPIISQINEVWPNVECRVLSSLPNVGITEELLNIYNEEQKYLQEIHRDMMKVLSEFDKVCRDNNLSYYLTGGSLIGAVRHAGFIPWDDDMDVCMPYEDYLKLKELAQSYWDRDEILLVDYDEVENNRFYDFVPRLLYMKTSYPVGTYNNVELKNNLKIKNRAGIDIFVLKSVSQHKVRSMFMEYGIKMIYALCMGHRDIIDYAEYNRKGKCFVWILKIINSIGSVLPLKFLFSVYELLGDCSERDSDYYFEPNQNILYIGTKVKKEHYSKGKDMLFEDLLVRVPSNCELQLEERGYKGFMHLPGNKSQRPSHVLSHKTIGW